VQFVEGAPIPGDITGAMEFRLDKSGKIYVFSAGKLTQGTWNYQNGRMNYKDTAGNKLTIQPGQTWIEIFPASMQNLVTWK
nr:DUF3048 C-terminal domain-containing protein [bacterium]